MWIIKTILFIWPFIKEMVLGNKSFKETVKNNKLKALFVVIFTLSVTLNAFTLERLFVISKEHLEMKAAQTSQVACKKEIIKEPAKIEVLAPVTEQVKHTPAKVEKETTVPVKARREKSVNPPPIKSVNPEAERYNRIKEQFNRIKKKEETEQIFEYGGPDPEYFFNAA